uniref:Secreted protein n=1 Tax=Amblyomma cajennense TaxID=34607 RepID=A0A023FBE9_AMBCJ
MELQLTVFCVPILLLFVLFAIACQNVFEVCTALLSCRKHSDSELWITFCKTMDTLAEQCSHAGYIHCVYTTVVQLIFACLALFIVI